MKVAIIGTTTWGTTLGLMLARRGIEVSLWARTKEEAERLDMARENSTRLPGVTFPQELSSTSSVEEAVESTSLVIVAVPSQDMRANMKQVKGHIDESTPILSAAKGLELENAKRMSQVIIEELGPGRGSATSVLSGPNLSREIIQGLPASTVVAAEDTQLAERIGEMMRSSAFHVYISDDVVGVELGGALKNVIALGAGMVDGLGYGNNAKAAYMARGLTEITRLGVAAGGNPLTFVGLACLGDLLATCSSPLSRNHTLGEGLAKGCNLENMKASMGNVVEGVATTAAALKLACKLGIELPISERIFGVLFEGLNPAKAMAELIGDV
ncbi:NAD(P)H-dependent glycerol-3-phosphate dehydrogenase [Chloroflexota bacterium]